MTLILPYQPPVSTQSNPDKGPVASLTHPEYNQCLANWEKWRLVYNCNDQFIDRYLEEFSRRENPQAFQRRKAMTPTPAFAAAGINEIKNSIFQRAVDISRQAGPSTYQASISGQQGGVDLEGATMNWFIGHYILPELLSMSKVGVYVDSPIIGPSLADKSNKHPYFYTYRAEDIRSWNTVHGELKAVLLRDRKYIVDQDTQLPLDYAESFRHLFIDSNSGLVKVKFYDSNGKNVSDSEGNKEITLNIEKIPFVIFRISDSLLRFVANHQIALLNLESSDIAYALKANFPIYTEQADSNGNGKLVRAAQQAWAQAANTDDLPQLPPGQHYANDPNSESCGTGDRDSDNTINVGAMEGRTFTTLRPGWIHPSPEPLKASMSKQEALKEDTRHLIHLAVSTLQPAQSSAESKAMDMQGLEAGLSYIGLELEHGERQLAEIWSLYENEEPPTINYPQQFSIKTPEQRSKEIIQLKELRDDLPSNSFKRESNKKIAALALGPSVSISTFDKINKELDASKVPSSDPKTIQLDISQGILSAETGSLARGYPEGEVAAAQAEHADRLARIAESQKSSQTDQNNPAARGIPDQSGNPVQAAAAEKVGKPQRGVAQ